MTVQPQPPDMEAPYIAAAGLDRLADTYARRINRRVLAVHERDGRELTEIAAAAGVPLSRLVKYTADVRPWKVDDLLRVSVVLGVRAGSLLDGSYDADGGPR